MGRECMNWAGRLAELEQRQRYIVAQLDWVEATLARQRQRTPVGTGSAPAEPPPPQVVSEEDKEVINAIERATANFLAEVRTGLEAGFPHRTGRANSRPQSVRRWARARTARRDAEEARGVRGLPGSGGSASGSGGGR